MKAEKVSKIQNIHHRNDYLLQNFQNFKVMSTVTKKNLDMILMEYQDSINQKPCGHLKNDVIIGSCRQSSDLRGISERGSDTKQFWLHCGTVQ